MIILHIITILLKLNLITIRILVRVLIQLNIAVGVCDLIGSLLHVISYGASWCRWLNFLMLILYLNTCVEQQCATIL